MCPGYQLMTASSSVATFFFGPGATSRRLCPSAGVCLHLAVMLSVNELRGRDVARKDRRQNIYTNLVMEWVSRIR